MTPPDQVKAPPRRARWLHKSSKQVKGARNVIRTELRIIGDPAASLRGDVLNPDPLDLFAQTFEQLREDLGDEARVAIDLVPLGRRGRNRFLRGVRHSADDPLKTSSKRGGGANLLDDLAAAAGLPGGSSSADRVKQSRQTKQLRDREEDIHFFQIQILIEVASEIPGRPQNLMQGFLAAFDQFAGADAHLRASGLPLFGKFYFGSDWWPRRKWFDFRMRTGLCLPAGRRNVVSAREALGVLKPPTKHCHSRAAVRSIGDVAPAPRNVAAYNRRPGVLPFGVAGGRMVGMEMNEMFFGYLSGRSRYGKTELALNQLLHTSLVEKMGGFFLDPHRDAIERIKPFLANELAMGRVIDLDFSHNDLNRKHVAWNPLSMEGRGTADIANRAQAIVDAASVVQRWGSSASRIPIITGQAAVSMLHLALLLPPDLAPTLFTMVTFLSDDKWRAHAITKLPKYLQDYWNHVYPGPDAAAPLINMIARIGRSDVARATLGSPRSTYDARRAMDERAIVLACPGGGREASMASFIVFDLLHAAKSRADVPPDKRPEFFAFFDELQAYDDGEVVPDSMEQCAKYGMRVVALNQSPQRLTQRTLDAISTNSSFLTTTATSAEGSQYFDKQWGDSGARGMVPKLLRYQYLTSITLDGGRSHPFRLAGLPIEQVWRHEDGDLRIPDPDALPMLEAVMDERYRPRTVQETLKQIVGHDQRVLDALMGNRTVTPSVDKEIVPEDVADWLDGLEEQAEQWARDGKPPAKWDNENAGVMEEDDRGPVNEREPEIEEPKEKPPEEPTDDDEADDDDGFDVRFGA